MASKKLDPEYIEVVQRALKEYKCLLDYGFQDDDGNEWSEDRVEEEKVRVRELMSGPFRLRSAKQ